MIVLFFYRVRTKKRAI